MNLRDKSGQNGICALLVVLAVVRAEERVATNEPQFVSRGGERRVKEGHSVDLSCEVTDLGEFVLLWKFNRSTVLFAGNLRIHRDDRISRNESGDLHIRDFRPENAGEYTCQVSTNPPQDIVYHVQLMGPPLIGGEAKTEVTARKGDPVELTCDTNAEHVEWRKDARAFSEERRVWIDRADRADAGLYSCVASNELGQTSKDFVLRVLYAPQLLLPRTVIHAPLGKQVVVECVVDSEPSANVNWFRHPNSKVLPSSHVKIDRNETTASLTLSSVSDDDYDEYSCVANNSLGSAVQSIHVTGKPSTPVITSAPLAGRQQSYLLEWNLESEAPILKYVIRWRARESSDDWTEATVEPNDDSVDVRKTFAFEVTSLTEDRSYEVTVHAHNRWGATASDLFAFVTSWALKTTPSLLVGVLLALTKFSVQISFQ